MSNKKATSVLLPAELYAWLKERAEQRQWSLNKTIVNLLQEAKEKDGVDK